MRRAVLFALSSLAFSVPLMAAPQLLAATAKAKPASYKAPHNSFGQPDLGAFWTNTTITNESRPAGLGDRAVYTPAEVAKLEGDVVTEIAAGNRPTDPNAPTYPKGGAPAAADGLRPQFEGVSSGVGGYNRGFADPGSSVMRVHGEPRTSLLTTPNGRPPARKGAAANTAAGGRGGGGGRAAVGGAGGEGSGLVGPLDNPEQRPLAERCIVSFGRNAGPPLLPNGFYNNNYRIAQGRDSVAIEAEMVHDTRIVRLNSSHRTDGVRPYFGDSIGHYEGDTLVVETTNIPQAQAYNGAWEHLTITEKFTRVSDSRLFYQYIISDPTIWDAPWGGEYEFTALAPGVHVEEYACHEGNYALEDVLAGARAEEAARRNNASTAR